jgi:putative DNA primase/helicase
MVDLARSEPGIPVVPDELDADRWSLNLLNGTLDLRTGRLRPHLREDRITKLAPVAHEPEAECPRWDAFLRKVVPHAEDRAFLQRAVGYSLTGDTSEEVLFILDGGGANGKSTFLETVRTMLGDYAQAAPEELFEARRRGAQHPKRRGFLASGSSRPSRLRRVAD